MFARGTILKHKTQPDTYVEFLRMENATIARVWPMKIRHQNNELWPVGPSKSITLTEYEPMTTEAR